MAQKGVINELVNDKVFTDEERLLAGLKALNDEFNVSIRNAKLFSDSLAGAKSLKDINVNSAKAAQELEKLKKLMQQTATATAQRAAAEDRAAQSSMRRQQAETKASEATKKASEAYERLNNAYKEATRAARNAGAEFGTSSKQFKDAAKEANNLRQQLDAIDKPLGNFQRNVGNYKSAIGGVVDSLKSWALGYISLNAAMGLVSKSFSVGLEANAIKTSLEFTLNSTDAANEKLKELRETANRLGLDFLPLAKTYSTFAGAARAANFPLAETDKIFKSIAGAGARFNLTSDQVSGALLAIQQMISKGTVQSEELRGQLGERLPGAFSIAARAMGVTEKELGKLLQTGQVAATDLLPKLADELNKTFSLDATTKVDNLTASTNRLKTAFDNVLQGDGIGKVFKSVVDGARGGLIALDGLVKSRSFKEFFARTFSFSGGEQFDAINKVSDNFKSSSNIGKDFNPIGASKQIINSTLTAKPLEELTKLRNLYIKAATEAATAVNTYKNGIKSGLITDGGENSIKEVEANFNRLQGILTQVNTAYKIVEARTPKAISSTKELTDAQLTSIKEIRKRITDLSAIPDSAIDGSAVNNRIDALKDRLKALADNGKKEASEAKRIAKEKKAAQEKADKEASDLQLANEKQALELRKQELENYITEEKRLREENIQSLTDASAEELLSIQDRANQSLIINEEAYAKGEIGKAQYEKNKLDIEHEAAVASMREQIRMANAILDIQEKAGIDTKAQRKALSDFKRKLDKEDADYEIAQIKTVGEARKRVNDEIKNLKDEVFKLGVTLVNASYENEKNQIQERKDALTEETQREIDAVNRSIGTQQEKADKIAIINAKAKAQQDVLDLRKREVAQRQAKFDKAVALSSVIQNTYAGAARALKDYPFPFSSIIAGLVIATGLASAANIIATPIPKYAKGTDYHKGGPMIVGDAGTELVIEPNGRQYLTPDTDTYTTAPTGTKVIPHHEVIKMLAKPDAVQYVGGQSIDIQALVAAQKQTTKAIQSQKMMGTLVTKKGWARQQARVSGWNSHKRNYLN